MPLAQMKYSHKKAKKLQLLVGTVMLALILLVLAHLAISSGQSGNRRYTHNHWIHNHETPRFDDIDSLFLMEGKVIWPVSAQEMHGPVMEADQKLLTSPQPHLMKDQDSKKEAKESAVWKIVLVVAILLVSVVGSLSMAYYLCVWRGGRIRYQSHKEGCP